MRKKGSVLLRFMASAALAAVLLTSCAGGAASYEKQMELGRKYLTEMNYTEAIAAFTEAIKLNPDDIDAYMARAEAYAALGKYDEAAADYTAVIEKTGEQPYLQAEAYAGRAAVCESTAALTDAESDYRAALAQLEKDTDEQDADTVLSLKKDILFKHAALCITLALLDNAAKDYDTLESLGENVTAKREELDDLVQNAADTDVENGLTPDTDAAGAETAGTADSKETAADSKEEQAASSKQEEGASSREEQPASSKQEEETESKAEEQPAQQTAQKESYTLKNPNWSEESATVSYQIGTNTVQITVVWDEESAHTVFEETYTLSQPLTSVEHPHKGSTVFHVPAGTVLTSKWSYSGTDTDGLGSGTNVGWSTVSSVSAVEYGGDASTTFSNSLTIKSGTVYAASNEDEAGGYVSFPAIGFTAD